jgi:hypothetical protein
VARHADRILEESAARELELKAQGLRVVTLPRAELIRKLSGKTAHSPFLTQLGWGRAVRGSTFVLNFGIMNPDPLVYSEFDLGLCVYWGTGTGVGDPGVSILAADPAVGVRAIELGFLNASASPYYISADHVLPAALAAGNSRSELSYLLYLVNAFDANEVLERGSISISIA